MKLKVQEKAEAIRLRKLGHSYREILKRVPVAKSSLSGWLRHLNLTPEQVVELEKRSKILQDKGRLKVALINRAKRIERERKVFNIAKIEFENYVNDTLFNIGVTMYWAEGSKKNPNFQFINSDPKVIKIMIMWIIKYLKIPRELIGIRLYIHRPYAHENCEEFWSKIIQIPVDKFKKTVYKPTPHSIKRNPHYKGCLRLEVSKIDNYRKVMVWQKLLSERLLMLQ